MKDQPQEIISGEKVTDLLNSLITSRHMCKVRIPNTHYCWITLLSDIKEEGQSSYLLIDGLPALGRALSVSRQKEVAVEYLDGGGILCHFQSRVVKSFPEIIWVECPEVIYRVQRRTYYRLKAQAGTELVFRRQGEKEEKVNVRDYSIGGAAFSAGKSLCLKTDDQLCDLRLRIPEGGDWLTFSVPLAVVRRVESSAGAFLYGLEFLEMPESTRKRLARHIFEKQRLLLRKFGKNAAASNPF
jgi:c-di-GMP-binding flagellar brake protein YcgR